MNGKKALLSLKATRSMVSIAAVVLVCLLVSPAVYADGFSMNGVTVSLTSASTTTTEGTPLTLDFNFQNSSGQSVSLLNVGLLGGGTNPAFVSGDPSDHITSVIYQECSGTIANGSSCSFSITLNSPADTGEVDQDSGVWILTSGVQVFFANGFAFQTNLTDQFTIKDPVAATPEPSTLLMFGAGLLGLAGRKLRKQRF